MLPMARRRAITEGLFGGSRKWLILGSLAWLVRGWQWAKTNDEQVVYRYELQPGETLVMAREHERPTRKEKRKQKKAS